jgi:PAS domain S-box-containing protein
MDDEDSPETFMEAIGPMFPDVADHAPVPLFSTDPAGRYIFVNKRWADLTGISARDALGWGWERALHPDDISAVVDRWQHCVITGEDLHARMRLLRPDGRVARVHMHAVAAPGRRGRTGFVGTLNLLPTAHPVPALAATGPGPGEPARPAPVPRAAPDAREPACGCLYTELTRAERARRDQDGRLTVLLAALPSPVLVADAGGRVVAVNPAFRALFGLADEPADLVGRDCAALARPAPGLLDDPAAFTARLELLLRGRRPVLAEEIMLADGRVFERSHVPVVDDGAYRGHLWVYVEVTERRIIEAETEGLIDAGVVTADGRLVIPSPHRGARAFARDLRAPLASIVSHVGLLRDGVAGRLSDEQASLLGVVAASADRLVELVSRGVAPQRPDRPRRWSGHHPGAPDAPG